MNKLFCILLGVLTALSVPLSRVSTEDAPNVRALPIVMYHSVCANHTNNYVLHPNKLRADLSFLKKNGYTPVFMKEVADFVMGKGQLPEKPIVLSFDDGYYNNYSTVLPMMREFGFRFVLSVVGRFIEKEEGESKRSNEYSCLNYEEIREMVQSGLVEVANHTYDWHHPRGNRVGMRPKKGESEADYRLALIEDSEKCRTLMQAHCGIGLNFFAYPFGFYNKWTVHIVRELGYSGILTCEQGINRIRRGEADALMRLKRFNRPNRFETDYFFNRVVKLQTGNNDG